MREGGFAYVKRWDAKSIISILITETLVSLYFVYFVYFVYMYE